MKRLLLSILALLFLLLCAHGEGLDLMVEGPIRSHQENRITAGTDAAGVLTFTVSDASGVCASWIEWVEAGECMTAWNGLGFNDEPLLPGDYTLSASLSAYDGRALTASTSVTLERGRNTLLYALPSSAVLYQEDTWFLEVRLLSSGGTVVMDIHRAGWKGSPLASRTRRINSRHPEQITWDGSVDGQPLSPGEYILRCYAEENLDYVYEVPLTIRAGSAPVLPLTVTGDIMPSRDMTDAEIWAIMQMPSVVADVGQTNHLQIRSGKGKGTVLGTVHGQSQAMQVLALEDKYARVGAWNHETGDYVEGWVTQKQLKTVTPSSAYGLLIDKQTQMCTLYRAGKAIDTVPISTGLVAEDRMIRETAAGAFLTVDRIGDFKGDGGFQYDYAIRYDGGNLLHQLGYREGRDFSEHTAQLGLKASHGCIRLPRIPTAQGTNAWWLYTHLPFHTRVIILDDPDQRRLQAAAAGENVPLTRTEPTVPAPLADGEFELVLTVGGDAVLATREAWWDRADALPAILAEKGLSYPFSGLQDIFEVDDMSLVNLECVLKGDSAGEDKKKLYRFRGLPEWAEMLPAASIEQVSIANNHHIDYGEAGRTSTREALEAASVAYSGFEHKYIWDVPAGDGTRSVRIGFGGCREAVWLEDPTIISRDTAAMKAAGCDVILYTCHWGTEYAPAHNDTQDRMAAAAAAAGVDIVLGGHPHVVQGVNTVEDTLVLYSLGNLMFGGTIDMTTFDAMLARLRLRFDAEGYAGCTVELIPVLTSGRAAEGINDYRPVVAEGEDRDRILQKVQADTAFPLMEEMWFAAE